jgi:hypothetical protein
VQLLLAQSMESLELSLLAKFSSTVNSVLRLVPKSDKLSAMSCESWQL